MKLHACSYRTLLLAAPLTCLLLASCGPTVRSQGQRYTDRKTAGGPGVIAQAADESFATVFTLATPMYLYFVAHERWPTSIKQLQEVAAEFDVPFDLSSYSRLDMQELQDGRLRVRFQLAPPSQSEGEFTLSKPDISNPDEGLDFQQTIVL